jgi:phosphoenolpyruvate-protein kinase (PTS system EI component)
MAGDPEGALALAALQVDALSVAVQQMPSIRQLLGRLCGREVATLKPEIFRQRTSAQVRSFLQAHTSASQLVEAAV